MSDQGFDYDLCVIGGGINGVGIARDAAGRGLKVLLLEKGDLACATSSASSKLIHGGLRYLEFYEFKLVKEALRERKVLLDNAPHIIWPMDFILPHHKDMRPLWMIRAGLFLYDYLAGRSALKKSKMLRLDEAEEGKSLKKKYERGFRYSDCWVQDSRLVVLNALDAAERGADILTYTECTSLQQKDGGWQVGYSENPEAEEAEIFVRAKAVVNAAGPWVDTFLHNMGLDTGQEGLPAVRLVKGSHIVVRKRYKGDQAYILQQKDGRIVFVLPYEDDFMLIGTTEEKYNDDPMEAVISEREQVYLLRAYNDYFGHKITAKSIVCSFSGVRPLYDDGQEDAKAVTRDYRFHVHKGTPPMISVYGGKITTYRKLAEGCVDQMLQIMGREGEHWTAYASLPGAREGYRGMEELYPYLSEKYPFLPEKLLRRYIQNYGALALYFLREAQSLEDLGTHYGDDIYDAELDYLIKQEWARTHQDVLWRRTKLLLHISERTLVNVKAAIAGKVQILKKERMRDHDGGEHAAGD